MKKLIITLMLFLMLVPSALAIEAGIVGLERLLSTKLDENHDSTIKAIRAESAGCKAGMADWGNSFMDGKEDDYRKILWYDRVITFFLIFFAVFLAGSFKGWREHNHRVKERQVEMAQNKSVKKQVIEQFLKASTSAEWKGIKVVAVRQEFMDKLKEEVK